MFGWWKRLLWQGNDTYDTYSPKDRLIFNYSDGQKMVHADPFVLYKKMMAVAPELDISMKLSVTPGLDAKTVEQAHNEVVDSVREIFTVKSLAEGGLTEIESVELLNQFLIFCGSVKKNSRILPTTPLFSEESKPSSGEDNAPTTTPTSVSG